MCILRLPSLEAVPDLLRQFSELHDSVPASAMNELGNLLHMNTLHHTFDSVQESLMRCSFACQAMIPLGPDRDA